MHPAIYLKLLKNRGSWVKTATEQPGYPLRVSKPQTNVMQLAGEAKSFASFKVL